MKYDNKTFAEQIINELKANGATVEQMAAIVRIIISMVRLNETDFNLARTAINQMNTLQEIEDYLTRLQA